MADNDDINPGDTPPPPPPPPGGGDPFAPKDMFRESGDIDAGQLESGKPTVAASPTRVFIVLGIMGILLLYLLYSIFFSGGGKDPKKIERAQQVGTIVPDNSKPAAPIELTPEQIPQPPPVDVPPVPVPDSLGDIKQEDDNANNKALLDRLKSGMLIVNGGGGIFGDDGKQAAEDQLAGTDSNLAFGNLVMKSNTRAKKTTATHIGDLSRTIAQGRVIQATMESAINTDLPGPIRAIVSRDIFAEAGTQPLIPKGSRLIGQYNSSILFGQNRVYVMWSRVIRPDGVDVMINSPLVDQIGNAGVGGVVDNKFREMFSRAVLASVFAIAVAVGVDHSGVDSKTTTTASALGGTQTTGDAAGQATIEALNNLGDTTTSFIQRFINVKPTIVVDQGTPVLVFVNQDLIFPSQYTGTQQIP